MKSETGTVIQIVTLGCAKNLVDSEYLLKQLTANNFSIIHQQELSRSAQIVIINTCGFISAAKEESVNTILKFVKLKQEGRIRQLYVIGCLSERYKSDLQKEIPEVDRFFGVYNIKQIVKELGGTYRSGLLGERQITTPAHFAYLKISDGCNRKCSFCAIPLIRGKHTSLSIEQCVNEAKGLVDNGVKELILVAQDLTYYGVDIYKKRALADLMRRLSDINGLEWIRLHYAYPAQFPLDVISVIKERSNICKYLDIPLQHISGNVLKHMKRAISEEETRELISSIRSEIPDITLRTTFLVGFPTETEKDFNRLAAYIEQTKFDRLGVFTYSPEEGTTSYKQYDDKIPASVKEKRLDTLMSMQRDISYELNKKKTGKIYKTLIDRVEEKYFIGRSEADSPEIDNEIIIPKSGKKVTEGRFYQVKIERVEPYDMYGSVC